ncbi:dienelactone hydrolase family protein [Pseudomonas sp. KU26590]|uniref:alpha/beta hydrolase n=1 Tax=Pseudomonas sp. KU26590 TaxID=2991051 RepID=UPI00223D8496|nr:dienelactone hydrolase family protein [Pseudomonas sp. KU26590]UZJ58980.1 dienelactone hydrolase family protein [Pseudomonas sp. KU26590]
MMKFFAALLCVFTGMAHAEPALLTDLALPYLAAAPAESKDKPLIIFLHGYGSDERDLLDIKNDLSPNDTFLSVRAPQEVDGGGYKWFSQDTDQAEYEGVTSDVDKSTDLLRTFIQQATEKYQTQPDKVILVGFSQGAMMSYQIGLQYPELVHGIAPLSGKILGSLHSRLKPDERLKSLKVFIGHGSADTRVPYSGATDAKAVLENLLIVPEFHAYAGAGHTITTAEVADLKHWLESELNSKAAD